MLLVMLAGIGICRNNLRKRDLVMQNNASNSTSKDSLFAPLTIGFAQFVISSCSFYSFSTLIPAWESHFATSKAVITFGLSLSILAAALSINVAGFFIKNGYGHYLLTLSTAATGLSLIFLSTSDDILSFYISWGIIGIFQGCAMTEACSALIIRSNIIQQRRALSIVSIFTGISSSFSFIFVAPLVEFLGWRLAISFCGLLILIFGIPSIFFGTRQLSNRSTPYVVLSKSLRKTNVICCKNIISVCVVSFFISVMTSSIMFHVINLMTQSGVNARDGAYLAACIGFAQIFGRIINLSNKIGSEKSILISGVLMIALAIAPFYIIQNNIMIFFFSTVTIGLSFGFISVPRQMITAKILGSGRSQAYTFVSMIFLCGFAFGPVISALAWDFFDKIGFLVCIFISLSIIAVMTLVIKID